LNNDLSTPGSKKKYWFYIEPYVFISLKKDSLLFYNSLSGKALEYDITLDENRGILDIAKKLQSSRNLRVVGLKNRELNDPVISQFIHHIRMDFMGDLIDTAFSAGKPVLMKPSVSISRDVKKLKKSSHRSAGEEIMGYITEMYLYITGRCSQNCSLCPSAFRQFPCCTQTRTSPVELEFPKIESLSDELAGTRIINLNILGGDIFSYSRFDELAQMLNAIPFKKTYYSHYLNIIPGIDRLKEVNPVNSLLKIPVTFPMDMEKLSAAVEVVKEYRFNPQIIFMISGQKDFDEAEIVVQESGLNKHLYQPWYTGNNLDFFKENVFVTPEDILNSKPRLKAIYRNSSVNSLNFGRLTVLADGSIYSNVNGARLGAAGKDSLYQVVYKEMVRGTAWLRTRKNVEPCKHCTLEALCPPLSDYSYAIGRNDLCIKNNNP